MEELSADEVRRLGDAWGEELATLWRFGEG